ncbi:MAG: hypothetical protein GY943_06770 [Chloroflexi bacterium]|nr:hypothetical protein [Chloroflexota bacterium]
MNQSGTIQRLTNHLKRIESEILDICRELKALPKQHKQQPVVDAIQYAFVDKIALRKKTQQLLLAFSIQDHPIGAEALQQQMREAELTSNELSQDIISAREE